MTLLNITIARDSRFAVLSADTYVSPAVTAEGVTRTGVCTDAAEAVAATYTDFGNSEVEPLGEAFKLTCYSDERLVVTGIGNFAMWENWTTAPAMIGDDCDIHRLIADGPEYLRSFAEQIPGGDSFIAVAAGWSIRELRAVVAAFQAPDFAAQELPPGNAQHPPADPEAEDHATLEALALAAADGEDTDGYHVRLARAQVAANRAGRLHPGVILGGRLSLARIDASGAKLRTLDAF